MYFRHSTPFFTDQVSFLSTMINYNTQKTCNKER